MAYPTSIDSFTSPSGTDYQSSPPHATQHANINTAVAALETKVGVNSSAVTTTHDYKLSGVTGTDKAMSLTGTETATNKRITKRVGTTASSATPTPTGDSVDMYTVTAQAEAATVAAPTGTPTNGQTLILRIKDNGTARALAFNAIYRFSTDLPAPTTTVLSKTLYLGFIYNSTSSTWDCLALLNNF